MSSAHPEWLFIDKFLVNGKTYTIYEVKPKKLFEAKYFRIKITDDSGLPERVRIEFRHFHDACHWVLLKSNDKIQYESNYQSIREIKKESNGS